MTKHAFLEGMGLGVLAGAAIGKIYNRGYRKQLYGDF